MARKLNFSSGPAMLPEEVLHRAQDAIWDLDGTGVGILEHSHRGKAFGRVLEAAERAVRDAGTIGNDLAVLFVTAGATHHFSLVPQNFLAPGQTADFCHTGVWTAKAMAEAKRVGGEGAVHVACSSEADGFSATPASCAFSSSPRYVHYTSNETIYGTQWAAPPVGAPAPLVCDASSDIFSRPLPLEGHGLIFAGAQKNLGPSGISVVIARRDFLETGSTTLAPIWQYRTYDREHSMYNTPNTFGIWMIGETCRWIIAHGGLRAMAEHAKARAAVLYDFLDGSKVWRGHAERASRSLMNVTFRGATPQLEERLLAEAEQRGMTGLKGHRSVGGIRASMYNAFPIEGARKLVELLAELERSG